MTVRVINSFLFSAPPYPPDHSTPFPFLPGWQFLESLALAAIDVGRIDVAEVGRTQSNPWYSSIWVWRLIMQLPPGLFESFKRRIPGVTTSTVPRGHFEGGKRES